MKNLNKWRNIFIGTCVVVMSGSALLIAYDTLAPRFCSDDPFDKYIDSTMSVTEKLHLNTIIKSRYICLKATGIASAPIDGKIEQMPCKWLEEFQAWTPENSSNKCRGVR